MSTTYPLTIPDYNVTDIKLSARVSVASSMSPFTLSQQVFAWPGERWEAEVAVAPIKLKEWARHWMMFIIKLRGQFGTFHMRADPHASTPFGGASGSPIIDGAHSAGVRTLASKNWPVSTNSLLRSGDYITVRSSSVNYLYIVLERVDSDGSGEAEIEIWPSLRGAVADTATIRYDDAIGIWRLASNVSDVNISHLQLYGFKFKAVEALPTS